MRKALTICAVLCAVSVASQAFPPPGADPNSEIGVWFRSLRAPGTGESCCGIADCKNYPVRIIDEAYQARFGGEWLEVPKGAILSGEDNPTGDYITCIAADYYYDGNLRPRVVCFKKAPRV